MGGPCCMCDGPKEGKTKSGKCNCLFLHFWHRTKFRFVCWWCLCRVSLAVNTRLRPPVSAVLPTLNNSICQPCYRSLAWRLARPARPREAPPPPRLALRSPSTIRQPLKISKLQSASAGPVLAAAACPRWATWRPAIARRSAIRPAAAEPAVLPAILSALCPALHLVPSSRRLLPTGRRARRLCREPGSRRPARFHRRRSRCPASRCPTSTCNLEGLICNLALTARQPRRRLRRRQPVQGLTSRAVAAAPALVQRPRTSTPSTKVFLWQAPTSLWWWTDTKVADQVAAVGPSKTLTKASTTPCRRLGSSPAAAAPTLSATPCPSGRTVNPVPTFQPKDRRVPDPWTEPANPQRLWQRPLAATLEAATRVTPNNPAPSSRLASSVRRAAHPTTTRATATTDRTAAATPAATA